MAGVETSEENDSSEELVPKKNCTSEIWQYFGFKREDVSQMQVLCKSCRKIVVTSRENKTNMPSNNKEVIQTTIDQSFASVTPYGITSKCHKELTEAITCFLAKDIMPVNTMSKKKLCESN